MFFAIYKNTLKTLLRSWSFWIAFAALAVVTLPTVWYRPIMAEGFEHLAPTTLSFWNYNLHISNLVTAYFLGYALPIFAVISTVLVLNRDYGDSFYEIEKAAGAKPACYLAGRLCAILSVQMALVLGWGGLLLHAHVIGWGGVENLSLGAYLVNSTVQMLRYTFACVLPCMGFYIGLTYMVGTLAKSGLIASFGGFGYVILYRVLRMFRVELVYVKGYRAAILYYEYLCHMPEKLFYYLLYYETGGMESAPFGKAAICVAFLVGCFAVFSVMSYLRVRKREA